MARTQVQAELIATNAISGTIIADNAITATHIATNAISGTLVQNGGIVTTMIAANNITSTKIVTDAVLTRHIADDQVTAAKLANSINTDIATGVTANTTANAALPKAGGTMTGTIAGFTSTGIDDNADATAITIDSSENVGIGGAPGAKLDVNSGTTNTMAHFHSTDDNGFIELKDDNTTGYIGVQDDYVYIGGAPSRSAQNLVINDGDGKVGIGTTSPSKALQIKGDNSALMISSADHDIAFLGPQGSTGDGADEGYFYLKDGGNTVVLLNSNGNSYLNGGNVGIGTADNLERTLTVSTGLAKTSTSTATPFAIQTGDANTNGRFSVHYIGGATAADRKVFLQMEEDGVANAGQLHFNYYGGTVHSPQGMIFGTETTAAHTLDDYEEGSWTIGVSSSDPGSMSVTVSNSYGWFVKVGKLVTLGGSFDLSTSSPQGTMRITGLPFACSSNGVRPLFVGSVGYTINVVPQPHLVTLGNGSSESYLDVWKQGNNTRYNVSDFNNGGRMNFQISYETA